MEYEHTSGEVELINPKGLFEGAKDGARGVAAWNGAGQYVILNVECFYESTQLIENPAAQWYQPPP